MQILVQNKRAQFDYQIQQKFTAGLVLSGGEVKSLRHKQASLKAAFVQIMGDDQVLLINAQITPYQYADNKDYDPKRSRKVLLRKKEIYQLKEAVSQKGCTIVPLSIVSAGGFVKMEIGVGRGKKQFEKKAVLKKRDLAREDRYNL